MRHPQARSTIEEMTSETNFLRYIPENTQNLTAPRDIRKHILCSGQLYYALVKARETKGVNDIAISRIEQYSPFPYDLLRDHIDTYPNAELVWAQEEPLNMGAWTYVNNRIQSTMNISECYKGKVGTINTQ